MRKFKLQGGYKRRENGVDIQPNEITELNHLDDKAIELLLQIGIYVEQSIGRKQIKTVKKGDK